ncbi:hypothetical protein V5O48_016551 [Marasmius crinis-equi]|uniref:Retrotransposon gag domain-containing protein n=1 Tax=Marasmius crinis-equi TaxID=585013 RepID=A0ABR3ERN9_9AGAR
MAISMDDLEFRGDVGEKLSSKNFLKKAEMQLMVMGATQAEYIEKMDLFLLYGSRAEKWWEELSEEAKGGGWVAFKKLFLIEFPPREVVKVTESERRRELLALRLKTEELGTKDKETKQWTHNAFADTLLEYAQAAGIAETSTNILSVHGTLPSILKKLVKDLAKTWVEFVAAIKALDIEEIKREKETEDQITALKRVSSTLITPETPRSKLTTTLANMQISTTASQQQHYALQNRAQGGNDPFSSPSRGRGNLFQRQKPQQNAAPRLTEEQRNVLKANIANYTQQPNTEAGEARWLVELVAFGKKWGNVPFHQDMVFPYWLGTLPPGSGECFGCSRAFHPTSGRPCETKLPILYYEKKFRNWVQRECGAYQKTVAAVAVNVVEAEDDGNWILAGYEAGKGSGSMV